MYSIPQVNRAILINLSTVHGLAPLSKVLDNFAKLHFHYARNGLNLEWYSKAWVFSKYLTLTRLIKDYKFGEIKTEQFLSHLLDIFYFLKDKENANELLKETWNSLITWNDESTNRLASLTHLVNSGKTVYFISNTNPLNSEKIIEFFNQYSNITWQLPEQTTPEPLKITKHFFLCPSYLFKKFKEGTPSLISDVDNLLKYQIRTYFTRESISARLR